MWRVMLGARTSILIAGAAVLMSLVIGLPLGVISGYFGGWVDNVLMRIVDATLAFPALLLALTISAVLGPNLRNTIIAIGVAFTPYLARIIRGEALRVAQMPYIEAARAAGTTDADDHPAPRPAQHHGPRSSCRPRSASPSRSWPRRG